MKHLLTVLTVICFLLPCFSVRAEVFSELFSDFKTDQLSIADKRFLQTALAFEGDYNGLLDGKWGRISDRALENYSRREFGTASENWHLAILGFSLFNLMEEEGWKIKYFPDLHLSFLFPDKTMFSEPPTELFENWKHSRSSLAISTGRHFDDTVNDLHAYTLNQHARSGTPYYVRKPGFAVTRSIGSDDAILYTRSDFIGDAWSTIILSANDGDGAILNAVTASISEGRTLPISYTKNGYLDAVLQLALDFTAQNEGGNNSHPQEQSRPDEVATGGSGTGFFVSEEGYVLTNAHVVQNCSKTTVDGANARIVKTDNYLDLAILSTSMPTDKEVAFFSIRSAKLNSDVTVVGYPYSGLLGGLNATRGTVSSMSGLQGDKLQMQITAPVQSGNSGGPVVGSSGEVVGVVVSKLDASLIEEVLGDVPQNVNFAIRGEVAKLFLSNQGIDPLLAITELELLPVDIAEKASKFTVLIECK